MSEGAVSIDTDIPVCESPDAAAAVRSYLLKACGLILADLGENAVAAIAVSGSAALGEFTSVKTAGGGLLLLSDVDLAVITRSDAQRDAARSIRPAILRTLNAVDEASLMCAAPELGVYSLGDLEAQAPKMGVVEMRASGLVLWGEKDVLKRLPDLGAGEMSRSEATALLYNRCFESLRAAGAARSKAPCGAINLLYAGAKAFLDAGTSLAAHHGRYVTGCRERLARVAEIVGKSYGDDLGFMSSEAFLEGLSFWTDFKIQTDLEKVGARYGRRGGGLIDAAWKAWIESRVPLAGVWTLLSEAQGARTDGSVLETCRGLIGFEPVLDRLRGWKRLVRAGEVPLSRAVALSRFGSPIHLLRLSAFCVLDQYNGTARETQLDTKARAFLESHFPAAVGADCRNADAEMWRGRVVETWSKWTERFWS